MALTFAVNRDLPNKKQLSKTSVISQCLRKILFQSPLKQQRYKRVKRCSTSKICLMNLFIERFPPRRKVGIFIVQSAVGPVSSKGLNLVKLRNTTCLNATTPPPPPLSSLLLPQCPRKLKSAAVRSLGNTYQESPGSLQTLKSRVTSLLARDLSYFFDFQKFSVQRVKQEYI